MNTSEQGYSLIRRYEGFSPTCYFCPAGKPTIGYGHVIQAGEDFSGGISEEVAGALLIQDVHGTEQGVRRLLTADVNQNQFDALMSFTYNVGIAALAKSSMLRFINAGNYGAAGDEFSRWIYGGGKKLDGLTARRAAEAALFLS